MNDDFRHDLREMTRSDHDRVDHALSALDLAQAQDFVRFLRIHRMAFGAMVPLCKTGSATREILTDICARIDDDLATLGAAPVAGAADVELAAVDPLAIDYMLEGSRLGSKVLRMQWARTSSAAVRRAARYFDTPAPVERWRAVCGALSAIPTDSLRAARIVRDTRRLFALFEVAQAAASRQPMPKAV